MRVEVTQRLRDVEDLIGRTLGDSEEPLLLSVRSGAKFSMPGMMETVLNVGLNDDTVEGVALRNGMAYSVQYHPESAAGPHDANPLFDQFEELMANHTPNK